MSGDELSFEAQLFDEEGSPVDISPIINNNSIVSQEIVDEIHSYQFYCLSSNSKLIKLTG